jgi:hypothetical protein
MVTSPGFPWGIVQRILKAVAFPPQLPEGAFLAAAEGDDVSNNQRLEFKCDIFATVVWEFAGATRTAPFLLCF